MQQSFIFNLEESIGQGAVILHGFALPFVDNLLTELDTIMGISPLRQMTTPGGRSMSVRTTSCGQYGWITDHHGYRYEAIDPLTKEPWPEMPMVFTVLAQSAALAAGYPQFHPDSCLINRYQTGTKLSLHQDKDEPDLSAPIVSVSLGLPAIFLFGGLERNREKKRYSLFNGDVVVWGGASRLAYHGINALKPGEHEIVGPYRINLTFRKVR